MAVFENLICMCDIPTNEEESPFSLSEAGVAATLGASNQMVFAGFKQFLTNIINMLRFIKIKLELKVCWLCLHSEHGIVKLSFQGSS